MGGSAIMGGEGEGIMGEEGADSLSWAEREKGSWAERGPIRYHGRRGRRDSLPWTCGVRPPMAVGAPCGVRQPLTVARGCPPRSQRADFGRVVSWRLVAMDTVRPVARPPLLPLSVKRAAPSLVCEAGRSFLSLFSEPLLPLSVKRAAPSLVCEASCSFPSPWPAPRPSGIDCVGRRQSL